METQKVILVAIIIVLFAALAFELKVIEDAIRSTSVTTGDQCEKLCAQKSEVPYVSDSSCFCKEPISFRKQWKCFANATFENDSMFSSKFNDMEIRDIAVESVVKYPAPNAPATKIFGIFNRVSSTIKYVSDPSGNEYVARPLETWESGGGDCDDFSVLLASMYEAVGLDASIVEVYNITSAHAFVIVRIEQDLDSFLISYKSMLEKYTPYFSEKPLNFVVFRNSASECESADKSLEAGGNTNTFYLVIESTSGDYPGSRDAFEGYSGERFIKVGK